MPTLEDPFFGCTPQDLGLSPEYATVAISNAKQEMVDGKEYQRILSFLVSAKTT